MTPDAISAAVRTLLATATASAQHQADTYLSRLDEVVSLDPINEHQVYRLPTALDLSADPLLAGSPEQKAAFGALYQVMACAFIARIQETKGGKEPIILYMSAATYRDYGFATASCHLDRLPVWLRYHAPDGGSFANSGDAGIRTLCERNGSPTEGSDVSATSSRCIIEQYTSFGGFAVFKPGAGLDLSRFYGSPQDFRRLFVAEN